MKKRQIFGFICTIVISLIVVATLRLFAPTSGVAQVDGNLLISAAASLKESLEEIKPLYQKSKQNMTIAYNFGASGALQQQIENGAPADIFISAAKKQMDTLQEKGLILTDTRQNLLTNRLVLIVPKRKSSSIKNFLALTDASVNKIAIGEPRSVPAGQYAEEVFKKLGILEKIRPKFVLGNNVRQVLVAVESGNADAGVVYATDARTSEQVTQVAIAPENLHSPIVYPIAVLKGSKNIPAAREYVQFLSANQAGTIFEKYGFGRTR